ncbi:MAG: YihY family inner membrane protein [Candidatus Cloacimonadaceae bacterium]|nr:YihY family inner membrane protein [Candidatus Cloacimonadaceae bacterium]
MRKKRKGLASRIYGGVTSYIGILIEDIMTIYTNLWIPEKRRQLWQNISRFFRLFLYKITTEGVLRESAGLTYITILGFIPFVTFLVMVIPDLPFLNLVDKLKDLIAANFMPGSADQVSNFLDETLKRRFTFNVFNFAIVIVTSYSLFRAIRNTFDRILSLEFHTGTDLLSQLIKFFGTLFFGMLIMILLFSSSSLPIVSGLFRLDALKRQLIFFIPFVMQYVGLIFLYTILPSIKINRSSLFRGAFWTTLVWVLAKSGFDFYILNLTNIQAVYGVLAAVPIFFMWIYINWVIILGGIVLVSVIEQKDKAEIVKRIPKKVLRLTVEMYTEQKLNTRIEEYLSKKDLSEIINMINEDEEQ